MAMVSPERVRARAEEFRTKVRSRIEEIRGGGSSPEHSPILGLELVKGPLVAEIREKGVIAAARARAEKFRAGGVLGGGAREEVAVEKDTGAIKFQRGRVAVEG